MSNNKLIKSASTVMLITIFSKIVGFFRDTLVARSFGATYQTDAYNMAITIPNVLFAVFSLAIATTFIPVLTETYKKHGKEEMFKFANNIINVILMFSVILAFLGWFLAPDIVKLMAPKFSGRTYDLTVQLTKLCILNIVLMSINSGFTAILQTLDDFTAPALVGIVMNIPIILYILLGSNHGIVGLTIVTVIGKVLEVLILIPWLIKHKYKYKIYVDIKDNRIKKVLKLIAPVIIGSGVNQLNTIVDKTIGSGLRDGTISALDYATKINSMVYSIFAMTIIIVVYPKLSQEVENNNVQSFKRYISTSINSINLIMIPSTVGLIILSNPIIEVLFKRGAFDDTAVYMTSMALKYYALGIIFFGTRDMLSRAFYSLKDTKTPMINGAIGVLINIIFNIILVKYLDIGGIALATSISAGITALLLGLNLHKRIGSFNGKQMLITNAKILIASTIMGLGVYFSNKVIIANFGLSKGAMLLSLLISTIIGMFIYSLLIYKFNIEEYKVMMETLKSKLKK